MSLETTITHVVSQNAAGVSLDAILKRTRQNASDDQTKKVIERMVGAKKITLANGKYTAPAAPAQADKPAPVPGKAAAAAAAKSASSAPAAAPDIKDVNRTLAKPEKDAIAAPDNPKAKTRDRILAQLDHTPRTSPALAALLKVDGANVSYHLNQLMKAGLAEKKPNPDDARAPLYVRTAKAPAAKKAEPAKPAKPSKPAASPSPAVKQTNKPEQSILSATLDRLTRASQEAQAALDQYVTSCCDAGILATLEACRDATLSALQQLQGKTA